MIEWNAVDKAEARRREVIIFRLGVSPEDFDDKGMPTDVHLIRYDIDGTTYCDAVRANKMVDIFDVYFDKLDLCGGRVIDIKSGYGTIKPKLWTSDEDKAKSKT